MNMARAQRILVTSATLTILAMAGCGRDDESPGGGGGSGGSTGGGAGSGAASGGSIGAAGSAGGGTAGLRWFTTCGDPVCGGPGGARPMPGVLACSGQKAGDACTKKDDTCNPSGMCNERLVCSDRDPKMQPGGCPISSRRYKDDIAYLSDVDLRRVADEVARLRLARWSYKGDPGRVSHLGIIIEDAPGSVAVDPTRERVDLYGYTSMAIAAVQAQRAELAAQRREIAALRRQIDRLARRR